MAVEIGKDYLFKLKHWKQWQIATVLFIGKRYMVVDKRFPGDTIGKEYCVALRGCVRFELKEIINAEIK